MAAMSTTPTGILLPTPYNPQTNMKCVYLHSCSSDMPREVQMVALATSLVTQVVQASGNVGPGASGDTARNVAQSCSSARKPSTASKLVTNHSTI